MSKRGKLIIIGGNENRGNGNSNMESDHMEFIEKSILSRVVQESGGSNAKIVLIPTASNIPDKVVESYLHAFRELSCENFEVADIRHRDDSEDEEYIEMIENADCVMFSGGSQSKIVHNIAGSSIHRILMERHNHEENFVIAGTSAGAMCMSEEMITGGGGKEFFNKGAVSMGEGLGFIPKLIIDSHFIRRGRFGRLAEAVTRFPEFIGVGLSEDTGLVVKNCNTFDVIGSGMVIIFDADSLTYNNEPELQTGNPMTIANLKTHILARGIQFNLDKRDIKVVHDSLILNP